ncbi:hypothetical protein NPIL_470861 [Nephila pilipes]|uniref:Uncharacterized protein n=1 Tax=Nephila pilipes TaxID=299642 RepID=A0A8X6R1U1_NEPPI|nr:hypothetical protein NPIL_470861 [Nephila pilipes]
MEILRIDLECFSTTCEELRMRHAIPCRSTTPCLSKYLHLRLNVSGPKPLDLNSPRSRITAATFRVSRRWDRKIRSFPSACLCHDRAFSYT